jgi:hypothetical protein
LLKKVDEGWHYPRHDQLEGHNAQRLERAIGIVSPNFGFDVGSCPEKPKDGKKRKWISEKS